MSERRASSEGFLAHSRRHSPSIEGPQDSTESLVDYHEPNPTKLLPRRRPLRAKSSPNVYGHLASLSWEDIDKAETRKLKTGRTVHKKASGGTSPRNSSSPRASSAGLESYEKDTLGFIPSLSRIIEDKENNPQRRRRSSTTSSSESYTQARRRRRPTDASAAVHRVSRSKHASLQRQAESLGNLPNPSLLSVLSGLTNSSNTSSGSNSTVTQKSYDKSHISKRKRTKEKPAVESKHSSRSKRPRDPETLQSSVFQYLNEAMESQEFQLEEGERPGSSSSSSSASSDHSQPEMPPAKPENHAVDSPMVSPTSGRLPFHEGPIHRDRFNSDSGISLRDSSPDTNARAPTSKRASVSYVEDDDEDADSEEDGDNVDTHPHHHTHHALERIPPPRLPSTSSAHSGDRHYHRLRSQEEELRQHVLQNPQPRRDFHFHGTSPNPQPSMPVFDPYAGSGASPANMYAMPHTTGWPPPAPAPPPMGYYSPPQMPPVPYSNPGAAMVAPPPFQHPTVQPPHYQPHPTGPDLTKTTVVGYELLADKLTEVTKDDAAREGKVLPMYRKFEKLNHRVLLHLQDEISELEEELRYLDEAIAQMSPGSEDGHIQPASRRAEARYGGELHYRRTDLLGRIYLKLGQYNQALSSFSTMLKNLDPANAEDIQAYHTWMEKHSPVDRSEARFLEHKQDLLSVSRRGSTNSIGGVGPVQSAAVGLPLILVLPLMAFAMIPGLLGRLFIIVLIGGMVVTVVVSTELMGLMTVREWATCASVYFGVMAILASVAA